MNPQISAHLLRLRKKNCFLATIALFAEYHFDSRVQKFLSDGKKVHINPEYFNQLNEQEKTGVILHTTLHSALQHRRRRANRDEAVWNIASDIVVNNIICDSGDFAAPPGTAHDQRYADLSAEQVYEALVNLDKTSSAVCEALLASPRSGVNDKADAEGAVPSQSTATRAHNERNIQIGPEALPPQLKTILLALYPQQADLRSPGPGIEDGAHDAGEQQYWENAFRKAETILRANSRRQGAMPLGLSREIHSASNPQLDWRWILWNFMARTPADFSGYDRRFAHRGLYLDALESERLNVLVAIDTSQSIGNDSLSQFLSELGDIVASYIHISVEVYCVDADIFGPIELPNAINSVHLMGGGGTNFSVLFEKLVNTKDLHELDLVIYFTDGRGRFPAQAPATETLWVVTEGGLESNLFPFGQVARLTNSFIEKK